MFVDTNVLVMASISNAPQRGVARQLIVDALISGEPLRTSRQVLREYIAVLTRPQPWGGPLPMERVLASVERFSRQFQLLEDGHRVTEWLMTLCAEVPMGGKQVHDANIVATMLAHGERRLLTFNGTDFRRFSRRIDVVGS